MDKITYADKVENGGASNEGKLFASDANEIKNVVNSNSLNQVIAYKSVADLPSAVGGVRTFSDNNMTYIFDGTFDIGTDELVFNGDSQEIKGSNCSASLIQSATTGNMITLSNSVQMSCLSLLNVGGGTILFAQDAGTDSLIIDKVAFIQGTQAIRIDNYKTVVIRTCGFLNNVNGILLENSINDILIAENDFRSLTGDTIDLDSATTNGISIRHNIGQMTATGTFLKILADSANILADGYGSIEFNKLDNSLGGTIITGYSPLDLGWLVIGNNQIVDSDRLEPEGFGFYVDDNSGGDQTAGDGEANAVKLSINGLASNTNTNNLPNVINGVSQLWDTTDDKITPIYEGDQYSIRISVSVVSTSSNPTFLSCALDIGDELSPFPQIRVFEDTKTLRSGGFPQIYTFSFPIFTLSTFIANGGKFFLYCNSGTAAFNSTSILISRTASGARP